MNIYISQYVHITFMIDFNCCLTFQLMLYLLKSAASFVFVVGMKFVLWI